MATSERIGFLLNRYTTGTISTGELEELRSFLNASDTAAEATEHLFQLLQQTEPLEKHSEARLNKLMEQIRDIDRATNAHPKRVSMRPIFFAQHWWWAAALILIGSVIAVFLISRQHNPAQEKLAQINDRRSQTEIQPGRNKAILTLSKKQTIVLDGASNGILAQQGNSRVVKLSNGQLAYNVTGKNNSEIPLNTMTTPAGGQYQLILPDGTKVWLNSSSSITFPAVFSGKERRVSVTGEVYVEVAKNKNMPFRINVSNCEIQVLGTHFNVSAYSDEQAIKTTLLEGNVRVKSAGNRSVDIRPGEQAVIVASGELTTNKEVNVDQVMAWKNGYFNFEQADIESVMRQISRWYDVEVVCEGAIPTDKLVGELPRDAGIHEVLNAFPKIQVHCRIEGKKIIVMR